MAQIILYLKVDETNSHHNILLPIKLTSQYCVVFLTHIAILCSLFNSRRNILQSFKLTSQYLVAFLTHITILCSLLNSLRNTLQPFSESIFSTFPRCISCIRPLCTKSAWSSFMWKIPQKLFTDHYIVKNFSDIILFV